MGISDFSVFSLILLKYLLLAFSPYVHLRSGHVLLHQSNITFVPL
jgi:hypothetical protein